MKNVPVHSNLDTFQSFWSMHLYHSPSMNKRDFLSAMPSYEWHNRKPQWHSVTYCTCDNRDLSKCLLWCRRGLQERRWSCDLLCERLAGLRPPPPWGETERRSLCGDKDRLLRWRLRSRLPELILLTGLEDLGRRGTRGLDDLSYHSTLIREKSHWLFIYLTVQKWEVKVSKHRLKADPKLL